MIIGMSTESMHTSVATPSLNRNVHVEPRLPGGIAKIGVQVNQLIKL